MAILAFMISKYLAMKCFFNLIKTIEGINKTTSIKSKIAGTVSPKKRNKIEQKSAVKTAVNEM